MIERFFNYHMPGLQQPQQGIHTLLLCTIAILSRHKAITHEGADALLVSFSRSFYAKDKAFHEIKHTALPALDAAIVEPWREEVCTAITLVLELHSEYAKQLLKLSMASPRVVNGGCLQLVQLANSPSALGSAFWSWLSGQREKVKNLGLVAQLKHAEQTLQGLRSTLEEILAEDRARVPPAKRTIRH